MDFKPIVRFAVMSDCHYEEEHPEYRERVRETIKYLYEYSKNLFFSDCAVNIALSTSAWKVR